MSTTEQDLKARLQARARESGIPAGYDRVRSQLLRKPEEEEDGFFSSLVEGAAVGALEPLGFLPPVSRFLDAHVAPESPHVGAKIGYALGWIGGLAVPSTAALKAASVGMRTAGVIGRLGTSALQTDRIRKFIAGADAVTDLGMKGNLIRGGVAGALIGAGRDAEDAGERLKNIGLEAAFFGIGDATLHPLMKAISGASLGGARSRAVEETARIAHRGQVETVEGAELLARAHRLVDEVFPEDLAAANPEFRQRKRAVQAGLARLGLQDLQPGQTRIIPSLKADASDIRNTLKGLSDIDFQIIKRRSGRNLDVSDVLVAPKGQLDDRLVRDYRKNLDKHGVGFFPGQLARFKGVDRIVLGPTQSGDKIWLYKLGAGGLGGSEKGKVAADISEVVFLPHGAWRSGPRSVKNPAGEWLKFVEKHGEFPEDFDTAFRQLAEEQGWGAAQQAEMEDYFTARLFESLNRLDKPLGDVLGKLAKVRPQAHPDGELMELGAQTGWIVGREVVEQNPTRDNVQLLTTIKHPKNANKIVFTNDDAAAAYMRKNPLEVPDFAGDLPSPLPKNNFGFSGASVMPEHTAVEVSNALDAAFENKGVRKLLMFGIGAKALPRLAWFRMMDDVLLEQGFETDIFSVTSQLQQSILRARDARIPWAERLLGIKTKGIRDEKLSVVRDLLLRPEREINKLLKQGVLNAEESEAAHQLKAYMRDLIGDINEHSKFNIDPDEFMEVYLPEIITRPPDGWQDRLVARLKAEDIKPNSRMIQFATEMERAGIPQGRHEHNPFIVALQWTSATMTKRHVDSALERAFQIANNLPTDDSMAGLVRKNLLDGIKVAYGGTPEAYYVTRVAASNYIEDLGIKLKTKDIDRMVATLVSMNYGAFMGFRPALAMRNLTQTVFVTMPMIQSPKHMGQGLKYGFSTAGRDEAMHALAIPPQSMALHMEDTVSRAEMYGALSAASNPAAKATGAALRVAGKLQEVAHVGLGGEIKVAGRSIPTGLYGRMDHLNRAIAYHAQKSKTLEAMSSWLGPTGHGNITRFNEEAGLSMLGPAQTREFHKLLNSAGSVKVGETTMPEAVRWISVQMANETQWVYQMGAGPAAFSQGIGRMFGMYGTWPTWYAQHLIRGATRGTARDKARFWGWSAATLGAMTASAYATGVNFNKWSPLASLTWTGGPALDFFADWRQIISGANPPGEPPSPGRALELGQRGVRDTGDRLPIPFLGHFDPRRGKGLDVTDPLKLGKDVLYLFTPGAGQVRNILQAGEEPTPARAAMRAAGLPTPFRPPFTSPFAPVAGGSWPQINIR